MSLYINCLFRRHTGRLFVWNVSVSNSSQMFKSLKWNFTSIWSIWHVLVGMHDIFLWSPASGFQSYAPFSYILINPYILIFCDKAEWWLLFYSQSVILSSRFFRIFYSLSDTWCVNEVFWVWNVLLLHRHSNVPCWIQRWFCDSSKYLGVIGWLYIATVKLCNHLCVWVWHFWCFPEDFP